MDPSIPHLLGNKLYRKALCPHQMLFRYFNAAWNSDKSVSHQHELAYWTLMNLYEDSCQNIGESPVLVQRNTERPIWDPPAPKSEAEKIHLTNQRDNLNEIRTRLIELRYVITEVLDSIPAESASEEEVQAWLRPPQEMGDQYFVNPDKDSKASFNPIVKSLKIALQILTYLVRCQANCFMEEFELLNVYLEQILLVLKVAEACAKTFPKSIKPEVTIHLHALMRLIVLGEDAVAPAYRNVQDLSVEYQLELCDTTTKFHSLNDIAVSIFGITRFSS